MQKLPQEQPKLRKIMRNKLRGFAVLMMLSAGLLLSCKQSESGEDETTAKDINVQKETQSEDTYKLDYSHISDGISRIAVTFFQDTTCQMGLSWYTPNKENYGNDVEIIEKSEMRLLDIEYKVEIGEAQYDEESMYHQTVINGLKPATEYYFRVGDKEAEEWSDYGTFKTSSEDIKEFTFMAVTDTQSEHLPDAYFSADTMERALQLAENPAFIMHSGDFVDDGDEEYLWLAQMNAAKAVMMNNIIVPAVGNHEEDVNAFWQHFKLEHTNEHKTTGLYYSYDYGNVHFVVLDTNKVNDDETSYIDDEQLQWLEEDLEKANENGAEWIIVNMHKGLYTLGEHSDNEKFDGEEGARIRVGSVFEEYGVDLVIQGHDHCPSITKPIKAGEVSDDGIIYINTGSAGAKSYGMEIVMPDEYYELFDYKASTERPNDTYQNFAVISVTEEKLNIKMYEINQLLVENNTYILKEIEINK